MGAHGGKVLPSKGSEIREILPEMVTFRIPPKG